MANANLASSTGTADISDITGHHGSHRKELAISHHRNRDNKTLETNRRRPCEQSNRRFDEPFRGLNNSHGGLLAFNLRYPKGVKPSLAAVQRLGGIAQAPVKMEPLKVEGNTIPPDLPSGVSDVIWDVWDIDGTPRFEEEILDQHGNIVDTIRELLDSSLPFAKERAASNLRFRFRIGAIFSTSELQVFHRGVVDGAIFLTDPLTRKRHYCLVWEVTPGNMAPGMMVDNSTARIADEQIRHRANSCDSNHVKPDMIFLSVIGCFIRPYLWLTSEKRIRPSNHDVPMLISRVSSTPAPSLWRDLRTLDGKRLFQQVVVDMVRISEGLRAQFPEMYGVEGEGHTQAPVVE
jgi:hypothetical protein